MLKIGGDLVIKFKKEDSKYGCFSNFYPCTVEYEGIVYPNSECAWQSLKTFDMDSRDKFATYTPAGAKKMGRRVSLRSDWEEVKYDLMVEVCYAKFSQNEGLKKILLSTGDEEIIENTTPWHDNIWGNCECEKCKNKEGKNLLGKALMEVRKSLNNYEDSPMKRRKNLVLNPLILVIDMQNVYAKNQKWECKNYERALEKTICLLEQSNGNDLFTRYIASKKPVGVWKDYNCENADVNSDEWLNELDNDLREGFKHVKCYDKSVYSAYSIEEVREVVEQSSCVVVTGVVAECCVLSTVMDLIDAGKYVFYISDAVAGINDETETATIKVLEGLSPLHLKIMKTDEYIEYRHNVLYGELDTIRACVY